MQLVEYPMLPENITIGDNPFSNLVLRESKLSPKGRQEGIHLGSTRNAREYVIDLLQARFQQVPAAVLTALEAIDDSKRLSDLHR